MEFRLKVFPGVDEDAEDAVPWLWGLEEEFAELDDVDVEQALDAVPDGAKGIGGLTELLVRVPVSGITVLVQFLQAWVIRTGRTVEVSIHGDTIKISGASREQQDRVIEAWLVHHAPGT